MASKRFSRVVVRSAKAEQLKAFLRGRELDVGGRPHLTRRGWVVEVYLPEQEAQGLAAEGCEFHVDSTYLDRLHADHVREQARRPSPEALKALLEKREFPAHPRDQQGRLKGHD